MGIYRMLRLGVLEGLRRGTKGHVAKGIWEYERLGIPHSGTDSELIGLSSWAEARIPPW
jgi:hypothetical protein